MQSIVWHSVGCESSWISGDEPCRRRSWRRRWCGSCPSTWWIANSRWGWRESHTWRQRRRAVTSRRPVPARACRLVGRGGSTGTRPAPARTATCTCHNWRAIAVVQSQPKHYHQFTFRSNFREFVVTFCPNQHILRYWILLRIITFFLLYNFPNSSKYLLFPSVWVQIINPFIAIVSN